MEIPDEVLSSVFSFIPIFQEYITCYADPRIECGSHFHLKDWSFSYKERKRVRESDDYCSRYRVPDSENQYVQIARSDKPWIIFGKDNGFRGKRSSPFFPGCARCLVLKTSSNVTEEMIRSHRHVYRVYYACKVMQVCKRWRDVGREAFLHQQNGWMILMASCSIRCDDLVDSLITIRPSQIGPIKMTLFLDAAEFFCKENRAKILKWLATSPFFTDQMKRSKEVRDILYVKAWEDHYPLTQLVFGKCDIPSCRCYKAHSDQIC